MRIPVTGGIQLAVRTANLDGAGSGGVPVLLVHGLASNARTWDGVADALAARNHPVAAVDQRGHGYSDKPDHGYDFATLTADLVAVIEALGWADRAPLVAGQSWGAHVTLELAVRHPQATRAIACVDGGTIELARRFPSWEQARGVLRPPRRTGLNVSELETMVRTWHPDWPEQGVLGTLANVEIRPDGTIAPWLSLDHHLTILRHLWEHRPSQRYPDVTVPVLLVPSAMVTADDIAAAQAGLRRVQVRRFEGADHDVHVQHPVEVAGLLHQATDGAFFG